MKVLVIGGAGFIGSHVCRKFVQEGHEVYVFGPELQESLLQDMESTITRIYGDILDESSLKMAFATADPHTVIHLAAYGAGSDGLARSAQHSPKKALEVNAIGFQNVLEAAVAQGTKKVLWSGSSTVFGPASIYGDEPVDESVKTEPSTFYGSTKVMNEMQTRFYNGMNGMQCCGLRLPLIYGPGRWYKGVGGALVDMFALADSEEPVVITGGGEEIDLMYVKDVAGAFYCAATSSQPLEPYYNVKSHKTSLSEMVDIVKRISGNERMSFEPTQSALVYPLMNTERFERELGYEPSYTVEAACADFLNSIRGNDQ